MTASAVTLGITGVACTFMPAEILTYCGIAASKPYELCVQIFGAMYFGYAMLNWMTKDAIIGGIYNRAIAIANLTHFTIAALALVKAVFSTQAMPLPFLLLAAVYTIFAVSFGIIFMTQPAKQ